MKNFWRQSSLYFSQVWLCGEVGRMGVRVLVGFSEWGWECYQLRTDTVAETTFPQAIGAKTQLIHMVLSLGVEQFTWEPWADQESTEIFTQLTFFKRTSLRHKWRVKANSGIRIQLLITHTAIDEIALSASTGFASRKYNYIITVKTIRPRT